jgi:phosphohistidine phosphatase SixA
MSRISCFSFSFEKIVIIRTGSIPRTWTYLFCTTARLAKDCSNSSDFGRPLTVTGKREVTDIAKSQKEFGVQFNFIITSLLKRSHQTASPIAMTFNSEINMENWDELKPEGNGKEFYRKLSQKFKQDSSILIVGHESYLSTLISEVISEGNRVGTASGRVVLKKAGLAKVRITSPSHQMIHGELSWLLTPKHMKKISK